MNDAKICFHDAVVVSGVSDFIFYFLFFIFYFDFDGVVFMGKGREASPAPAQGDAVTAALGRRREELLWELHKTKIHREMLLCQLVETERAMAARLAAARGHPPRRRSLAAGRPAPGAGVRVAGTPWRSRRTRTVPSRRRAPVTRRSPRGGAGARRR